MGKPVLEVQELKKYFPAGGGKFVRAVDGVNLTIAEHETLGLVGESGSGKSTVAYTVVGMYRPTGGKILYRGQDVSFEAPRRSRAQKGKIQIVFQDPGSSLNPRRSIQQIVGMPVRVHKTNGNKSVREKVEELLDMVALPSEYLDSTPQSLSGGDRQLVAIARALATDPELIILDEPTSALDVSVQAKVINRLVKLQREFGLSYLFITHDLSLMRNVATRVAIMYLGAVCEHAPTRDFFTNPLHPYTRMLLSSIPVVSDDEESLKPTRVLSQGEIPSPVNVPSGCRFHSRCPFAEPICREVRPPLEETVANHWVACHFVENGVFTKDAPEVSDAPESSAS